MEINDAVKAMSALAQESRLEVFRLLVRSGDEGLPAGQIAEALEIPAATLSFHLKELLNANLVKQRRAGRSLIYTLNVCEMRDLLSYLMEDCCAGRPELCQPDYDAAGSCEPCSTKRTRRKAKKSTS